MLLREGVKKTHQRVPKISRTREDILDRAPVVGHKARVFTLVSLVSKFRLTNQVRLLRLVVRVIKMG